MLIFQYFIFDKTGNHIIDANGIVCDDREEVEQYANEFVIYYKTSGEMNDNQLSLFCFADNGVRECLFESTKQ